MDSNNLNPPFSGSMNPNMYQPLYQPVLLKTDSDQFFFGYPVENFHHFNASYLQQSIPATIIDQMNILQPPQPSNVKQEFISNQIADQNPQYF